MEIEIKAIRFICDACGTASELVDKAQHLLPMNWTSKVKKIYGADTCMSTVRTHLADKTIHHCPRCTGIR